MPKPGPLLVAIDDAAAALAVSEDTIRRMIADKTIDPVRVRGALRIRWSALLALAGQPASCCSDTPHTHSRGEAS